MDSELYNTYANYSCSEVPPESLKIVFTNLLYEASLDMGQSFDKNFLVDRVAYIIDRHYNHLPLSLVASAFRRGALGQYGTGRLIPRTVSGWLSEMNQYYMNIHERKDETDKVHHKFDGLEKYPLGQAICKKMDWLASGGITVDQWESIPLKAVAEMIGKGEMPTLAKFGIYIHKGGKSFFEICWQAIRVTLNYFIGSAFSNNAFCILFNKHPQKK